MVCIDSTMSFGMALREQLSRLFCSVSSPHSCLAHCPGEGECYRFVVWKNICLRERQPINGCHTMTKI
jgi:hypothetical protein